MNEKDLIKFLKSEEEIAYIHGWDFSHIDGRYMEYTDFPWDYKKTIESYLTPEKMLLDIDTGGGEFLLSLNHPYTNTAATENYPPNVKLCEETFIPLGINFKRADVKNKLPFRDNSFDIVINRHGNLSPSEFYRVLKNGGIFISQQVGAENDRELVELLCGKLHLPFPNQYASIIADEFKNAGFKILQKKECFRPIRFFDLGALTWFARVLPWEFPNFSVDNNIKNLLNAQKALKNKGYIEGKTHRFFILAQK